MTYGSGEFVYESEPGWAKLPAGWKWEHSAGMAFDEEDNLFVLNRSEHPIIVFDRDGNFVRSFGEGLFGRAHGISIGPDRNIYTTDDYMHVTRKFAPDGTLLQTWGTWGQPSDTGYIKGAPAIEAIKSITQAAGPFNRPTKMIKAPWGELYVTDGYGNARVHRFTAEGELIQSWGAPGGGPGEFRVPHSIVVDGRGRLVVCDRENNRIQLFTRSGEHLDTWDLYGASDITVDKAGRLIVAYRFQSVAILDLDGNRLGGFKAEDAMHGNHSIAIDSAGNLYVGESAEEEGVETLHRFARVS